MKHISELSNILNKYFDWNKARITCLAEILKGIIAVKTVNLSQIATIFSSKAQTSSSYRRIQRFFKEFDFNPFIIVHFILTIIPLPRKFLIIMDRTNWKLGNTHFNLLVFSIAYKGIAIPIYWMNLARGGSSHTDHRIYSIVKIICAIGKKRISCILADREFIGKEWFSWLLENKINFAIRIRENMLVSRFSKDRYPIPAAGLFKYLKTTKRKFLKDPIFLDDLSVYLSASRSPAGELLIVATPNFDRKSLNNYKKRWQIENLFSCLKSKGFNLEDTHLTEQKKVEKLLFIVVIAFCWAYLAGIEKNNMKKIPTKTHGRRAQNLFRYGYDILRKALFQGLQELRKYFRLLMSDRRINVHV